MEPDVPPTLLSLPAELRDMIYDHVVPRVPLEHPRSLYIGIMDTCKQLRAGIEHKVLANMQEDLDDIVRGCLIHWNDVFTFSKPPTLHALENLVLHGRISFSKRILKLRQPRTHRHHYIKRLLRMHFQTLTIELDCNHDAAYPGTYCIIDTDWITRHFSTHENQHLWPCLKSLSLDWSQALVCGVGGRKPAGGHVKVIQQESLIWDLRTGRREDEEPISFTFQRKHTSRSLRG